MNNNVLSLGLPCLETTDYQPQDLFYATASAIVFIVCEHAENKNFMGLEFAWQSWAVVALCHSYNKVIFINPTALINIFALSQLNQ